MKLLITVIALFIWNLSPNLYAQQTENVDSKIFEDKTYLSNQIIGIKNFKYNDSIISKIELYVPKDKYIYGNITTFQKGKFTSGNRGPCGNECRITVTGSYTIKKDKISLFLETIAYWKDCKNNPTQIINKKIGIFTWNKDQNGNLQLTAVK